MRTSLVLIALLTVSGSFSQMHPAGKVYIVEGVVADKETLKGIRSAVVYNDSLSIMTTSDERGYFKLVVPVELIRKMKMIPVGIVKKGYKRTGSFIHYNPIDPDSNQVSVSTEEKWNDNIEFFLMANNESPLFSSSGSRMRTQKNVFNSTVVMDAYSKVIVSEMRRRKINQLKEGNEKIFFIIDGKAVIAFDSSGAYFDNASPIIFFNNKRVKIAEINRQLKRSSARVDWSKSDSLSTRYKKDVIVFVVDK